MTDITSWVSGSRRLRRKQAGEDFSTWAVSNQNRVDKVPSDFLIACSGAIKALMASKAHSLPIASQMVWTPGSP